MSYQLALIVHFPMQISGDVLAVCFPGNSNASSTLSSPITQLQPHIPSSDQERYGRLLVFSECVCISLPPLFSHMWNSLQRTVDLTVPLYKWDKSHLQECYHGILKVDPGVCAVLIG